MLLSLGFWQLDRAGDKQALLARWQDQAESRSWSELQAEGLNPGQPVVIRGKYDQRRHWLLDNRTRNGQPGYELLSLFHPQAGPAVVVNRGWLAAPRRRDERPAFTTPADPVELQGRVAEFPQPPVLDSVAEPTGWPRRVQALSPAQAQAEEPSLAGYLLRLADESQPGAKRADWQLDVMGAQTHYGYALQWFSLAAALVVLTLVASYRKTDSNDEQSHG